MADALAASLYPGLRGASLIARSPLATSLPHTSAHAAHLTRHEAQAAAPPELAAPRVSSRASRTRSAPISATELRRAAIIVAGFLIVGAAAAIIGGPVTPGGTPQLWTVLITGITTGGLSCLAVQGGLLATSLTASDGTQSVARERVIVSFLASKLVAYTLLGALLGMFGSVMQLSVSTRGMMQLAIGVFMILTGIRMVRPHPWLNFVALEPPAAARRLIRKVSRQDDGLATPIFCGALTVLIPCGVTQAMMAVAITTANPLAGAVTMAAFTLGTSPLFFSLSYVASKVGQGIERQFNRIVAVLIIILGYVAIQTGAILVGHPLPIRPLFTNLAPPSAVVKAKDAGGVQGVDVTVHVDGYAPNNVSFTAGKPAELVMVTSHITGCTRTLNVPKLNIQQPLKVTGRTVVKIPAQKAGTSLEWVCGMGMFTGTMRFR